MLQFQPLQKRLHVGLNISYRYLEYLRNIRFHPDAAFLTARLVEWFVWFRISLLDGIWNYMVISSCSKKQILLMHCTQFITYLIEQQYVLLYNSKGSRVQSWVQVILVSWYILSLWNFLPSEQVARYDLPTRLPALGHKFFPCREISKWWIAGQLTDNRRSLQDICSHRLMMTGYTARVEEHTAM